VWWAVRSLSPEEAELWARVTASIRPLSRDKQDRLEDSKIEFVASKPLGMVPPPRPAEIHPKWIENLRSATLDGGWDRRLKSGRVEPDRTLDLHGHSVDRAWVAIDSELERAIISGERILLLITGHERRGDPPLERGRIRAAVYDWLTHSRHASRIAAVRNAHRRHGGGGSLYVILRKS
jgi:DNA-nicking Smr family endonuclease